MDWSDFYFLMIFVGWSLTGIYRSYALSKGLLDHPNERSSHIVPVPRGGGIALWIGWFGFMGVYYYLGYFELNKILLFLPLLIVIAVGFYDDRKGAPSWLRLILQISSAVLFLGLLGDDGSVLAAHTDFQLSHISWYLLTVFLFVWMINLFNFMDGSDGFAACQAIFVLGTGGYAFWYAHAAWLAILAWAMCALLIGFLVWNWPLAKIFMGDTGSAALGLLIAMMAWIGYQNYNISLYFWVILTSLFWFDASITLLRRIFAREKWLKAHRKHAYQRLIQRGWSHQRLLLSAIVVNMVCVYLAIHGLGHSTRWYFLLTVNIVMMLVLYLMVEVLRPMFGNWFGEKQHYWNEN